jgi:ABC-2 type transport system permease protein
MRVRGLVVRIWRQFLRDKRTLALMLIAPLIILTLISLIFNGSTYKPKVGLVDLPSPLATRLAGANLVVSDYTSAQTALAALKKQQLDAYVEIQGVTPHIVLEGSDPATNKVILLDIQNAMQSLQSASPVEQSQSAGTVHHPAASFAKPIVSYLYGSANMTSFDNFGPVLIGFFAFFLVFLVAGISFLKERTSGTLERLVSTPIRRSEIVLGYVLGFGFFTTVQAVLVTWFSVDVLGMMMHGSFLLLLLITFLLSLTALTLGILLSAFAHSEFQIMQLIPIVIVPQVFFSGLFNLDTMAPWLRWLSKVMPLYYGADAMRNVMIRGLGITHIWIDLIVLFGLSLVFMVMNVIALRKYRKV